MKDRALQFASQETFETALRLLSRLAASELIEFELLGDHDILLPEWSFNKLAPLLEEHNVGATELEVVSMRDLSPEEQAELRGLNWGNGQHNRTFSS